MCSFCAGFLIGSIISPLSSGPGSAALSSGSAPGLAGLLQSTEARAELEIGLSQPDLVKPQLQNHWGLTLLTVIPLNNNSLLSSNTFVEYPVCTCCAQLFMSYVIFYKTP